MNTNKRELRFTLNQIEQERAELFMERVKRECGSYGLFEYKFTPTSIGDIINIYSDLLDAEIDITDYETW